MSTKSLVQKEISSTSILNNGEKFEHFAPLFHDAHAIIFKDFFSPIELGNIVNKIYEIRDQWLPNYDGEQYSLGRVWYTHFDEKIDDEYFRNAEESKKMITSNFPGLYEKIIKLCTSIEKGANISIRDGWAGPGFAIFPAHGRCAEIGGDIHYDWEGLTDGQLDDQNAEGYSFIAMLSKPESGGGLKIWDIKYDQARKQEELVAWAESPDAPYTLIDYQLGDLVMINSFYLHQIQTFSGDIDRICLTFHIARHKENQWYIWF